MEVPFWFIFCEETTSFQEVVRWGDIMHFERWVEAHLLIWKKMTISAKPNLNRFGQFTIHLFIKPYWPAHILWIESYCNFQLFWNFRMLLAVCLYDRRFVWHFAAIHHSKILANAWLFRFYQTPILPQWWSTVKFLNSVNCSWLVVLKYGNKIFIQ